MESGETPKIKVKKRSPAKVAKILDRGTKILELRKSGASLRAISRELIRQAEANGEDTKGLSYGQVKRDFDEIVALRIDEQQDMVAEARVIAAERLDEVVIHLMPVLRSKLGTKDNDDLVRAKIQAGNVIVRATKEYAELHGAKRPQPVEVFTPDGKPLIPKDISITIESVYGGSFDPADPYATHDNDGDAGGDAEGTA